MNIRKASAGYVTEDHILSYGFHVFDTIKGNDMGQMEYVLPQFQKGEWTIEGGYWNYVVRKNKEKVWEGWWNTNEEFDATMDELNIQA